MIIKCLIAVEINIFDKQINIIYRVIDPNMVL